MVPVPYDQLPVMLPQTAEFTGTGESPLAGVPEFVNTSVRSARVLLVVTLTRWIRSSIHRGTSSVTAIRGMKQRRSTRRSRAQWTPVDQYIGGDSHAVMHLIYTRFWTKFMRDIGLVNFDEPVKRLLTQGMVTNRVEGTDEWKAMSKSLGNGVDPDEMIEAFGADATRMFVLFAAPVENELRWLESGIEGAVRFLRRVYTIVWKWQERLSNPIKAGAMEFSPEARTLRRKTHQTIAKITSDFEQLDLNTSVAALMELFNQIVDFNASRTAKTSSCEALAGSALKSAS